MPFSISGGGTIAFNLEQVREIYHDDHPVYAGPYNLTPGTEVQTLETNGKRMTDNITVDAIPNNYGLITWNGSVLTVS